MIRLSWLQFRAQAVTAAAALAAVAVVLAVSSPAPRAGCRRIPLALHGRHRGPVPDARASSGSSGERR